MLLSQPDRDQLIGEFWDAVRSQLIEHYRQPSPKADEGIGVYRHTVFLRGIGDLVYHQGVERTAEVINGIIEHGLPHLVD